MNDNVNPKTGATPPAPAVFATKTRTRIIKTFRVFVNRTEKEKLVPLPSGDFVKVVLFDDLNELDLTALLAARVED